MNREWRLRFLKLMVNLPFFLIDRVLKLPDASYPQTRMLQSMYRDALEVYRHHASEGVFGTRPDGHFPRFLSVTVKVLSLIGEEDRYYRAWLGLSILMVKEQYEEYARTVTPGQLKEQIKAQWLDDLSFLPDELINRYKADFVEIALANSHANLLPAKADSETSNNAFKRSQRNTPT